MVKAIFDQLGSGIAALQVEKKIFIREHWLWQSAI